MPVMGFQTAGLIAMWSGTLATIPDGFALCDGSGGRPNLLNYFVKGVPNTSTNPGGIGGSSTHSHAGGESHSHSINSHSHGSSDASNQIGSNAGTGSASRAQYGHTHSVDAGSGTSDTANVGTSTDNGEPPYYALAFIYKLL
jgi:hypothetical protein